MTFLLSLKLHNYKLASLKTADAISPSVYPKELEKSMSRKRHFLDNIMCNVSICCTHYHKAFINIIAETQ